MQFIEHEKANKHHPTIEFTAEISETEATFLDTNIYSGERFRRNLVLHVRTHFKSLPPTRCQKSFIKGEVLRLFRTNSSKKIFEDRAK